jgi:integrative and conjugative element protein (TIGR02256 family)
MLSVVSRIAGRIDVPSSTLSILSNHAQLPHQNETGGVLAGYRNTCSWVISHPMAPSPQNRSGHRWLKRHRIDAQRFIDTVFDESNGTVNYLGEWHTHPVSCPSTSPEDRQMLRDLLRTSVLEIPFLIGIIVGNTGRIIIWCQSGDGNYEVVHKP